MPETSLASRLDTAVEEILKAPGAAALAGGRDLRPLAVLAAGLAGLPRERFRKRLKTSLAKPRRAGLPPSRPTRRPVSGSWSRRPGRIRPASGSCTSATSRGSMRSSCGGFVSGPRRRT